MSESKPIKWSDLRERAANIYSLAGLAELLADLDAAAPAMAQQERDAARWRQFDDHAAGYMRVMIDADIAAEKAEWEAEP